MTNLNQSNQIPPEDEGVSPVNNTVKPCIECGKDCEILPVQLGDLFTLESQRSMREYFEANPMLL